MVLYITKMSVMTTFMVHTTNMNRAELADALRFLGLDAREAGRLLSVDFKTVGRWLDGPTAVPGPAAEALRAWVRLERERIPWRPDGLPLRIMSDEEIDKQIELMRQHVVSLDDVLQRVNQRGGPAAPWTVDLKQHRAELAGTMVVNFYALPNGNFSPSSYRRTDKHPDYERDRPLIEDAIACIAETIGRAGEGWIKA